MTTGVSAVLALSVGSDKTLDELSLIGVDPLVDGLMADFKVWVLIFEPSGDEFWRPAFADSSGDSAADPGVFETFAGSALAVALIGSTLSLVGEVVPASNGRDISLKLAGDSRRAPAQLLGDLSE